MSLFNRKGTLEDYFKTAPVTSIVLIINLLMLIVVSLFGGFNSYNLLRLGALYSPVVISNNEWWRLLTSMFLHGSFMHFLGNAIIGLYVLSGALERLVGSKKFALIYFISGIGAGLLVTFTSSALTIGASGAIFGALGSLLYIGIYRKDMMSVKDFQSIKGLVMFNIFFTFLTPGISIGGHIGGIVTGFLLSYLLIKNKPIEKEYVYTYTGFDEYDKLHEDPWGGS